MPCVKEGSESIASAIGPQKQSHPSELECFLQDRLFPWLMAKRVSVIYLKSVMFSALMETDIDLGLIYFVLIIFCYYIMC